MSAAVPAAASRDAPASLATDHWFQTIFHAVNDAILILDPTTGRLIEVNQPGCRMFGYSRDELIGRNVMGTFSSGIHPYTEEKAFERVERDSAQGDAHRLEWQCKTKEGVLFWIEFSVRFATCGDDRVIISVLRDITERKELDDRFKQIAEHISDVFWMTDPDKGEILYVSPGYEALWGRSCESLYENPRQWLSSIHEDDRERITECAQHLADGDYREEYRIVRPDGEVRWISDRAYPVRDDSGRIYRIAGAASDITRRKRLAEQIEHMAYHDTLTQLPNRASFMTAMDRAIARSLRTGRSFALLSLDLDHFKDVNDTLGHAAGDQVLQLVAKRLQAELRRNDIVARFGGDEFAVLLDDPRGPAEIAALASRIITAISEPCRIDGVETYVGASVGVAISGKDGCDAETLMSRADIALYQAKAGGRRTCRFFSDAMNEEVQTRVKLTNELRLAIPRGELFLDYQPQVTAARGAIVGVEALVRWRHPEHGVLAPGQFLPAAESSGLIGPLGAWVLRTACWQGRRWIDAGISPGSISVNLSSVQFNDPLELEELVLANLAETGLPPHLLELEITESTLLGLSSQQGQMIRRLHRAGVRIALDNFGVGSSSLKHLRQYSIDRVKISRELISRIAGDSKIASFVKFFLSFARESGSNVVAEGVETVEQLGLLQDWNCPDIQGFYFATPMSADDIAPLLRAGTIEATTCDAGPIAARSGAPGGQQPETLLEGRSDTHGDE